MIANSLKLGGFCTLALALAGCADGGFMQPKKETGAAFIAAAFTPTLKSWNPGTGTCHSRGETVYYELTTNPVILEWCESTEADWAQRDYYYVPLNGGQPVFGYAVLVSCAGQSGRYIENTIGVAGKADVCALD